jgi:hypothetical protein
MRTLSTAASILFVLSVHGGCFAAQPTWYRDPNEICAEYVAKNFGQKSKDPAPSPLKRDPTIEKYIAEFNAASGTEDQGGNALLAIDAYCLSNGGKKIRDIKAREVIDTLNSTDTHLRTSRMALRINIGGSRPCCCGPSWKCCDWQSRWERFIERQMK